MPGSDPKKPTFKVDVPAHEVDLKRTRELALLGGAAETRRWYQGCLTIEPRLAAFGPLFAADPATQFCFQSARRNLGEFEAARQWYGRFAATHPDGPWQRNAQAELWLANRSGPPPKPVLTCRHTDDRPYLDGNLDDACWTAHKPERLRDAVGATAKDHATEVWLAYDKDFLYVAVRCRHPEGGQAEKVKVRPRDADVRPFDRVGLLLDVDRDYATCFHLQIDQRGCVCEDCWGDATWNPRWFAASTSGPEGWTAEAAIPLVELTGDGITAGRAWAANVVRVLPGRGVQAAATPADVQPRPEGLGLLLFTDPPRKPDATTSLPPMQRVP